MIYTLHPQSAMLKMLCLSSENTEVKVTVEKPRVLQPCSLLPFVVTIQTLLLFFMILHSLL